MFHRPYNPKAMTTSNVLGVIFLVIIPLSIPTGASGNAVWVNAEGATVGGNNGVQANMSRSGYQDELTALLSFKSLIRSSDLTAGPLSSWNTSVDYCTWSGVTCNVGQRVSHLHLNSSGISGTISPALANLTFLEVLNLRNNTFHGRIPSEIGSLLLLTELTLLDNSLEGEIPSDLGYLPSIQKLSLGRNNLSGEIPPSIYNLSTLQVLLVGRNRLFGKLPKYVGETLPNLFALHLYDNQFEGPIPLSLTNATQLRDLQLWDNSFTGAIPPNLGALWGLQELDLGGNRLQAREPSDWTFLESLSNSSNLRYLDLRENDLGGTLPVSVTNLSLKVEILSLGSNNISGHVPDGIGKLLGLRELYLQRNMLVGSLPAEIGKLAGLEFLDVSDNELSGRIPSSLGDCMILKDLHMEGNLFEGEIPSSFNKLKDVVAMDLSRNHINGSIPEFMAKLQSLRHLNLSFNSLEGKVPHAGIFLGNSSDVSLQGNDGLCSDILTLNLKECSAENGHGHGHRHQHPSSTLILLMIAVIIIIVV